MRANPDESGSCADEASGTDVGKPRPDRVALDRLFIEKYDEIRKLAARLRWRGMNATEGPTDLANSAYLKLLNDPPDFESRSYEEIIAVFANAIRQIIVDAARRKRALKRNRDAVPEEAAAGVEDELTDWLTVADVLEDLGNDHPRQRQIIYSRFYLGLTVEETAAALNLSPTTIERDWREAKLYLSSKVRPEGR